MIVLTISVVTRITMRLAIRIVCVIIMMIVLVMVAVIVAVIIITITFTFGTSSSNYSNGHSRSDGTSSRNRTVFINIIIDDRSKNDRNAISNGKVSAFAISSIFFIVVKQASEIIMSIRLGNAGRVEPNSRPTIYTHVT